jgi:hypothetical protein
MVGKDNWFSFINLFTDSKLLLRAQSITLAVGPEEVKQIFFLIGQEE